MHTINIYNYEYIKDVYYDLLSEITIISNLDMTGQYMYNSHSLPVFQIACLYALANFFQSFTVITLYSLIKC